MTDLPGSPELVLILFAKLLETVEVFRTLKGFLDVLDDLGSDATPMTPRAVVGSVRSSNKHGTAYMGDAYNEVLPLKSIRDL